MATAEKRVAKIQPEVLSSQATGPASRQLSKLSVEAVVPQASAPAARRVEKAYVEAVGPAGSNGERRALTKMSVEVLANALNPIEPSRRLMKQYVEVLLSQQEKLFVGLPDLGEVNPFLLRMPVVSIVRAVASYQGDDVETPIEDCKRVWYRMTYTKSNGQQLIPFVDDEDRQKPNATGHDNPEPF